MIRDLEFPGDAVRVIDALHSGLQYDAAIAVMGHACAKIPLPADGMPELTFAFRVSGREADEAVRRDAVGLLSRLAFTSMVSRIDSAAQSLLLQRRVLEELAKTGQRLSPETTWALLRKVHKEFRNGPVQLCSQLVVEQPSPESA